MRIYAQDLGPKWEAELLQRRLGSVRAPAPAASASRMNPPERSRAEDVALDRTRVTAPGAASLTTPLPSATAVCVIASLVVATLIALLTLPPAEGILVTAGLCSAAGYSGLVIARAELRRHCGQPVKPRELDDVLAWAQETDQAFLSLARSAARQSYPPEVEASLRAAIRALGEAAHRLPVGPSDRVESAALRAEAERLLAQAQAEPDDITAGSLERRARAIHQRAEANERSTLLAKRSEALHAEIDAQLAALRDTLAVFHNQAPDIAPFESLAEAARQVAMEATCVASAREELDLFVARGPTLAATERIVLDKQ